MAFTRGYFEEAKGLLATRMPQTLSGNAAIHQFLDELTIDPNTRPAEDSPQAHRQFMRMVCQQGIITSATRYCLHPAQERHEEGTAGQITTSGDVLKKMDYGTQAVTRKQVAGMIDNIKEIVFSGWKKDGDNYLVKTGISNKDASTTVEWLKALAVAHGVQFYNSLQSQGKEIRVLRAPLEEIAGREGIAELVEECDPVLAKIGPTSEPGATTKSI